MVYDYKDINDCFVLNLEFYMLKKSLLAAAIMSVSFGATADWELNVTSALYGAEQFGTEVDIVLPDQSKLVKMSLSNPNGIAKAQYFSITYELSEGTLASALANSSLVIADASGVEVSGANIVITGGGGVGDTFVSYGVQNDIFLDDGSTIDLNIGNLNAKVTSDLVFSVSVAQDIGNLAPDPLRPVDTTVVPCTGCTDVLVEVVPSYVIGSDISSASADMEINVSQREEFSSVVATGKLGLISIATASPAGKRVDGTGSIVLEDDDAIQIVVTGDFNSFSAVSIDLDSATEGLTTDLVGAISVVDGLSATFDTTMKDIRPIDQILLFVTADGVNQIPVGDYTAEVTYTPDTANSIPVVESLDLKSTSYSGLVMAGFAQAVPNSSQSDLANIRVQNLTNNDVNLFMDGYGQDGQALGYVEFGTLPANATEVFNASELENLLGEWSGRAFIQFYSDDVNNISVQTMVRTNGMLNNMGGEQQGGIIKN